MRMRTNMIFTDIYLSVNNGFHQRTLSAAVGTAKTISLSSLHVQARVGQKHHGSVTERELNVAQILSLLLYVFLQFRIIYACSVTLIHVLLMSM
jgi:hypothetical protein